MAEILLLNMVQVSLAVGLVLLPLLLVRSTLRKRYAAAGLCLVWMVLAVRLLVPVQLVSFNAPMHTLIAKQSRSVVFIGGTQYNGPAATSVEKADATAGTAQTETHRAIPMTLQEVLTLVWLTVVAALTVMQAAAYAVFRKGVSRTATPAPDTMRTLFEAEKAAMQVQRDVRLRVVRGVEGPMLMGVFRPVLLLPEADFSTTELRVIPPRIDTLQTSRFMAQIAARLHAHAPLV